MFTHKRLYGVFWLAQNELPNQTKRELAMMAYGHNKRRVIRYAKRVEGVVIAHRYTKGDVWDGPTFQTTGDLVVDFRKEK